MKLFLANVDNYFNAAVSLITNCTNFPFRMAIFHPVISESTKGNQFLLKPITVYSVYRLSV